MQKILFILWLLILVKPLASQSFKAETSDLIDGDIGIPVLLMKDGTTIFQFEDEKERKTYFTIFERIINAL